MRKLSGARASKLLRETKKRESASIENVDLKKDFEKKELEKVVDRENPPR